MRCGWAFKYFKEGFTKEYVFLSAPGKEGEKDFIEDYNSKYEDNKSFCELIGEFVERITKDEEYAFKIVKILAKKLKCDKDLLKKPRNSDTIMDLTSKSIKNDEKLQKMMKEFTKNPKCTKCGKKFINDIDSKTKKISKYLWKPTCKCINKNFRLSIG